MPSTQDAQPVVAGSANCIVVDDEPGVRRSLVRMLQAQGFTCFEAGSGLEALDLLGAHRRDPAHRLRHADAGARRDRVPRGGPAALPDTSVIMLTGLSDTTTAVDCLHLGAADFLLKPISMNELQARVARALEKRALVLQNRYYQENLERRVHEQAQRIQELFLQGVQMLARALEAKDAYTRGHSIRVLPLRRRHRPAHGLPGRLAGRHPPGWRVARHRQDRHRRRGAPQAGQADRRGVRPHQACTPSWATAFWPTSSNSPMCCRPCCTTTSSGTAAAIRSSSSASRFR